MIERSAEDFASPIMNAAQIRDFADRILYRAAGRLAQCDDWTSVGMDRDIESKGGGTSHFGFEAEWDEEDDAMRYTITLQRAQPFDKEWPDQVVAGLLGNRHSYGEMGDDDEYEGSITYKTSDSDDDDGEDEEDYRPDGYISLDYDYTLKIPVATGEAVIARRDTSYSIYDEDRDPVDSEIVHDSALIGSKINILDLERLVRFGEIALNQSEKEQEFSEITLWDLQMIFGCLKSYGVVTRRTKLLSSRVFEPSQA